MISRPRRRRVGQAKTPRDSRVARERERDVDRHTSRNTDMQADRQTRRHERERESDIGTETETKRMC